MKKTIRIYLGLLTVANVLLALGMRLVAAGMSMGYGQERDHLPYLTAWAIEFHWWPYLASGSCILMLVLSVSADLAERFLLHFVLILLLVEAFILFTTSFALVLPFVGFP